MKFVSLALLLLFGTGTVAVSEEELRVNAGEITETRTANSKRWTHDYCQLHLEFSGEAISNSMGIVAVRVLQATNNLGENIVAEKPRPFQFRTSRLLERTWNHTIATSVHLKTSARTAKTISIQAEVDLYHPENDPKSRALLTHFISNPDAWLQSETLKEAGVKIMFVGREKYEALQDMARFRPTLPTTVGLEGPGEARNALRFRVEDPNNRILKLVVENASGKPLEPPYATMQGDKYRVLAYATKPPTDSQVVVYLDGPTVIRTVPFRVENVPLP